VFRVFGENTERLRGLLLDAITALPVDLDCACPRALDGITLPFTLPGVDRSRSDVRRRDRGGRLVVSGPLSRYAAATACPSWRPVRGERPAARPGRR
jgi:hypothetical protein